jgi:glutathione peroxidase
MSTALYDIPLTSIDGESTSLAQYRGKVLLIVNVASKCGLTPQYRALEWLYSKYREAGLVVLGFPANDFAGQEPGSNEEIATFCTSNFAVDFPMFSKITVTGSSAHPLYKGLVEEFPGALGDTREGFRKNLSGFLAKSGATTNPDPGVLWNFEKFLIGRDGKVLARFSPETTPEDPLLITWVERALAQK